jgi:two-component system sensor histidine kinase CpxA
MRPHFPLFAKILVWFFVNLLALGAVFLVFFNLQLSFSPGSPLFAVSGSRLLTVARLINDELRAAVSADRAAILQRYSESYKVDFLLVSDVGEDLAGLGRQVPAEVRRILAEARPPGPPFPRPRQPAFEDRPPGPRQPGMPPPNARPDPIFRLKTSSPTRYWAGVRMMLFEREQFAPVRATLLAASDSISGHGLFFDPKPWLYIASVVLVLSILLWFPFVRGLTRSITQMTAAAEQIAEEHFDVRVKERRSDELGRLGAAINRLA